MQSERNPQSIPQAKPLPKKKYVPPMLKVITLSTKGEIFPSAIVPNFDEDPSPSSHPSLFDSNPIDGDA